MRVGYAGRSSVVRKSENGINCASLIITRGSKNHNSNFLCYVINSSIGKIQTILTQNGTAQQVVNLGSWKDFLISYPSITEQNQIADFLDKKTAQFDTSSGVPRSPDGIFEIIKSLNF